MASGELFLISRMSSRARLRMHGAIGLLISAVDAAGARCECSFGRQNAVSIGVPLIFSSVHRELPAGALLITC